MRFAETVVPLIPSSFHDAIAQVLAILFYYLRIRQRMAVEKNLRHILHDRPVKEWMIKRLIWRTYRKFALCFLDTTRIPFFQNKDLDRIFEDQATENLQRALSYQRGAILISLHLGNWDLAGVLLGHLGFPIVAVTERLEERYLNFFKKRRERTGIETILTNETMKLIRALKKNKVVVLVADRDITGKGKVVSFFNGKRKIPLGPIKLARRFKVPVVFGYLPLHDTARYLGRIEPPVFLGEDLTENLKMMVGWFERVIRRYPDQWFVFEDEWIE